MASKRFQEYIRTRTEARQVDAQGLRLGLTKFAVSGPAPTAFRIIKRDPAGIIQFDGEDPSDPNIYSRAGVPDTMLDELLAWLKDNRAEIEFQNSQGWINAANGEINNEFADEADPVTKPVVAQVAEPVAAAPAAQADVPVVAPPPPPPPA